jgi:hypothetical protein
LAGFFSGMRTSALRCSWRTVTCKRSPGSQRIRPHELTRISSALPACARHHPVNTDTIWHLTATTVLRSAAFASWNARLQSGGEMLFKVAFVLWIAWLLGVLGLYRVGDLVHLLLLVGLMLLLLAFLRAREVAVRRAIGGRPDNP